MCKCVINNVARKCTERDSNRPGGNSHHIQVDISHKLYSTMTIIFDRYVLKGSRMLFFWSKTGYCIALHSRSIELLLVTGQLPLAYIMVTWINWNRGRKIRHLPQIKLLSGDYFFIFCSSLGRDRRSHCG